jgi:hypothetical protein
MSLSYQEVHEMSTPLPPPSPSGPGPDEHGNGTTASSAPAVRVLGFLLAAVAMYTAFALLMEDSRGREVLPIGRLGMARQATHGSLAIQLRDIERQAGVRRTL